MRRPSPVLMDSEFQNEMFSLCSGQMRRCLSVTEIRPRRSEGRALNLQSASDPQVS